MAKCSSFAIGAGPAIPKRTGSRICRRASSRSQRSEGAGIESELRHDLHAQAGTCGECLLGSRASQSTAVGTALWPSGCPAMPIWLMPDSSKIRDSQHIHGAGEFADRPRRVAGDQQDVLDPAGAQFLEGGAERLRIRHASDRDVRRRVKPGALHREGRVNHLAKAGMGRMRHIDTRTARKHGLEFRQAILLRRSNFGGGATHEGGDAALQVIRRRRRMPCLTVVDHKCLSSEGLPQYYRLRVWLAPRVSDL